MGSLLGVVLALAVSNGATGQDIADKKPAAEVAGTEPSLMKEAIDGITVLANKVTPIQPASAAGDKTAESAPAAVVWVHLSKKYLSDYVERKVDHEKPARENVLGIMFTGQSHTTGKTRLVLHSNDNRATADVEFVGTVHSRTAGHSGPATLQYLSESTFHARKPLVVGDSGVKTSTAVVDAPTRLTPTSISTSLPGLRGRIGDRIARRREAGSRGQAEAIVGRDTANDIRHDFDVKLDTAVAEIQNKVQAQIAALKSNGEDARVVMQSRSTPDFVEVALCPEGSARVEMASNSPFAGNPDLAVRVHRSAMASLASNAELRDQFAPMLGSIVAGSVGAQSDTKSPKWSFNGEWLSIDLSGVSEPEAQARLAVANGPTSR
jgi:hypothetical protein